MYQPNKDEFLISIKNELREEIFQEIQNEAKQLLIITPEQEAYLKEKLLLKLKKLDSIMDSLERNEIVLRAKKSNLPHTNKLSRPHDIVSISSKSPNILIQKSKDLYSQGYSLNAIARELKISKSTIRKYLFNAGVPLRSHSKKNANTKTEVAPRNAPYGYFLFKGSLHEDSKEQMVIQIILELDQKGLSQGAIARHLNSHQIKPRKALTWKQVTIGIILKRISKGGT